jgi:hypothetical protein
VSAAPVSLRLHTVPAVQGLAWVRQAFRLYRERPLGFTGMLSAFLMVSLAVSVLLPYAGAVLSLMALPLLSLGFMMASQAALRKQPVHLGQFVEPLRLSTRSRRRALLLLCAIYGGLMLAALLGSDAADGGALDQLMTAGPGGSGSVTEAQMLAMAPQLMRSLLLRAGLTALLAVPFWHAPALAYWAGQGVGQSLFSSTLACWRNRGAFFVYGLAWLGLALAFGMLSTSLFALLGAPQLLGGAMIAGSLVFSTAFYLSLYFTFVDSFKPAAGAEGPMAGA